jgi:hypothetical protein
MVVMVLSIAEDKYDEKPKNNFDQNLNQIWTKLLSVENSNKNIEHWEFEQKISKTLNAGN